VLWPMYCCVKEGADFVIPSRFIPGGSDGGLNLYRKLISATARYIGKIFLPSLRHITDPTSGLFMFAREVIDTDRPLQPIGWKIMVEVLALGVYHHVMEIPYKFSARAAGESKLSTKVTMEYLKQVASLMFRGRHPRNVSYGRWTTEQMKAANDTLQK